MSRFALLCSWEREAVTRYGLLCFALLRFVLFARARGKLSHVMICFAFASLRFALMICGMTKKTNQKHAVRHAKSKLKVC